MARHDEWPDTPLSTILELRGREPARAQAALRRILALYYDPICAYMRRHAPSQEAEEWAHAFVEKVVDDRLPAKADPARPLRYYVVAALRHFIADRYRAQRNGPRTGHAEEDLEARLLDSDAHFHRDWAEVLVQRALRRLDAQPPVGGDEAQAAEDVRILRLKYGLGGEGRALSYDEIKARLGRDCPAHEIDNALRRVRRRLADALRAEMRSLLASDQGADEELCKLSELL